METSFTPETAPQVQPWDCRTHITDRPAPHFSVPNKSSVAVGNRNAGPTPQMSEPGFSFSGDNQSVRLACCS